MEQVNTSVFNDPQYEYHLPEELKKKAYEELNENPETVRQEVEVFRGKVNDIDGLWSRSDDCFLLAFLRSLKFDQEKALKTLKEYYKFRQTYPEYFEPLLVSDNKAYYYDAKLFTIQPETDRLGRTINVVRIGKIDFSKVTIDHILRTVFTSFDCLLLDQKFHVGGLVFLLDFTDFGLSHLRQLTMKVATVFCNVLLNTYPIEYKAIHIVNAPLYFHVALRLFMPFMPQKILNRVFIHGSQISTLDSHINQETLPDFCGGTDTEFNNGWWVKHMEELEETLKENFTKYGYHRNTISTKE